MAEIVKRSNSISFLMQKRDKNADDPDTEILVRIDINIENLHAAYEIWHWDGIVGESLIFDSNDVTGLSEKELIRLLCKNKLIEITSDYTIKTTEDGLLFISFNFVSDI